MTPESQQEPHADKAAAKPDAALIALAGEFHEAHETAKTAGEKWRTEQDRILALPDCPPSVTPRESQEGYKRHEAFLTKHGILALSDNSTKCWRRTGKIACEIFATPAHALEGAVAKLKIVRLALGDTPNGGDHDLDAYEPDSDERWFATVMRDFERLIQPSGPDPFVDLAKRYIAAADEFESTRGKTDEEAEAYDVNVRTPLEQQLAKLRPTSREGIVAALGLVLRDHRETWGGGEELGWAKEYVISLLENARDAVDAGQGAPS